MRQTCSGILLPGPPDAIIPSGPPGAIPVWQDILERKQEIASREWVMANAPDYIKRNLERGANQPWVENMDGAYYRDTRLPFLNVADTTVTYGAGTTSVLLHQAEFTTLPAGYWTPGKKLKLTIWGAWVTAVTPGNYTFEIRYGTTSNGGTILQTTAAVAAGASKSSITKVEAVITCRLIGATGLTIFALGKITVDQLSLIIPAANNPWMIPSGATPLAIAIDTTSTVAGFHGINIQAKHSGSTADTWTTHDLTFEALN